ncbi:hypothetical protein, variant [Loa loa]|uniref:Uncharacterized protein n=1 Tax=Loa loa TaxID=7209 RepID=A0A1S0TLR7_LOALO|nr:hypothetical protein LOAG_12143 [Loa loa]XP_020305260.1 hypothetical protein, variant [Loa loa]EFO16363.2 hypothetical protein LOAG_12143 [Loa loa]EJD74335.1 hypothetical protein, variant [Loa loa]
MPNPRSFGHVDRKGNGRCQVKQMVSEIKLCGVYGLFSEYGGKYTEAIINPWRKPSSISRKKEFKLNFRKRHGNDKFSFRPKQTVQQGIIVTQQDVYYELFANLRFMNVLLSCRRCRWVTTVVILTELPCKYLVF